MSPIKDEYTVHVYLSSLGKYLDRVDSVMTQVDRITEDIDHMPVAAFIFRDNESKKIQYSRQIRLTENRFLSSKIKILIIFLNLGTACLLHW